MTCVASSLPWLVLLSMMMVVVDLLSPRFGLLGDCLSVGGCFGRFGSLPGPLVLLGFGGSLGWPAIDVVPHDVWYWPFPVGALVKL